jgi:hypothetical protein
MDTEENAKQGRRYAIADACFRCKGPIVKIEEYSEDNIHSGAPVTATVEKHYVTSHGALCQKCYPRYVSMWREHVMAKRWAT